MSIEQDTLLTKIDGEESQPDQGTTPGRIRGENLPGLSNQYVHRSGRRRITPGRIRVMHFRWDMGIQRQPYHRNPSPFGYRGTRSDDGIFPLRSSGRIPLRSG
ncbi:hypothetical protein Fot_16216 [Forsythia ovata]|uniref:Uncharacterized protein n=1 Tax=Forsythia ovata TaxID=205694 RepID=A0ABD1WDS4_9LAMI